MTPPRTAIALLLTLLALASGGSEAATPTKVLILLSHPQGVYAQTAQAIEANLTPAQRARVELLVQSPEEFNTAIAQAHPADVIVTVGVEAAQHAAQANPAVPILYALLPRESATEILRSGRGERPATRRDSALFLDQPLNRQLDLIRTALPRYKRVAAILGPATQQLAPELRNAAREHALTPAIVTIAERSELLPALEDLLENNDILLSVAEPLAYHGDIIHHLLLTTYRYKIPVVGLSKAYVDAGALLAVYSGPEQIGRQIAEILAGLPSNGDIKLPPSQFPRYFQVTVNRRVAASLDLNLDSDAELQQRLNALSRP